MVECQVVNKGVGGSIHLPLFRNVGNFIHPTFACVFRKRHDTKKAGGPFCLVSMPGEVKDPTQGVNV